MPTATGLETSVTDFAIGRREYGQKGIRKERSYHCAIMDEVVYESETTIEMDPTSDYFGMRVCLKHQDEQSYESRRIQSPPDVSSDEENQP